MGRYHQKGVTGSLMCHEETQQARRDLEFSVRDKLIVGDLPQEIAA